MTLNWWAIVVAAIAQWLLGWAWYSVIFGKQWMALSGITKEGQQAKGESMLKSIIGGLIGAFVMSLAFAYIVMMMGQPLSLSWGVVFGVVLWFGFIATTMINNVLYEQKSFKLFLINSGYYLVALIIMGLILTAWPATTKLNQIAPGYCYTNTDGSTICTN